MDFLDIIITLLMLVLLQAVLGFDNLLYISLESKRVPADKQAFTRKIGIALAVIFRIVLLFFIISLVEKFKAPFFGIHLGAVLPPPEGSHAGEVQRGINSIVHGDFNLHALIVLLGGVFIIYTAVKEIFHMLGQDDLHHGNTKPVPVGRAVALIVVMNLIFSFDSILSAMALADNNFPLMMIAILIGGGLMIWLSDKVANFLEKNRMYEVLGLFILFIVGIMLLTEGGHLAHLHIGGQEIVPMTKTTFYFVIGVLVLIDIVQSRYQKKLLAKKQHTQKSLVPDEASS